MKNKINYFSFLKNAKNIDQNVNSYNDVMAALFHHGDWRRARKLFEDMELESIDRPELTPTTETYNVLLKGMFLCKSKSQIDEATRIFDR